MIAWRLACQHWAPAELDPALLTQHEGTMLLLAPPPKGTEADCATMLPLLHARLAGRRPTMALRSVTLDEVVARALGGAQVCNALLRAALAPIPDLATFRRWCESALDLAKDGGLPVILPAPDRDAAAALSALLCQIAAQRGLSLLPPGLDGPGCTRLQVHSGLESAQRTLARSRGPAICIVQAEPQSVQEALSHLARVLPWPGPGLAALMAWLRPLHIAPELASEHLLTLLQQDPFHARRLVLALIERAGSALIEGTATLDRQWPAELRAMTATRRLDLVHPQAARLAGLLAVSPGGLAAGAVQAAPDLRRAAELLMATGLASQSGDLLLPQPALQAQDAWVTRRLHCRWLAEREHFCPYTVPARRAAWAASLRMRSGDLAAWAEAGCEALFADLIKHGLANDALALCEAHAACAARHGTGPPAVQVLLTARELASALWGPRRTRRMLRLWTRRYEGDWRALLLALLALQQRQLKGPEAYGPLVDKAAKLAQHLPRLPREQALIVAATACCFEDPQRAISLLDAVGREPAQATRLLSLARTLSVRAECALISINFPAAMDYLQQARAALHPKAYAPLLARLEAEIEAQQVMAFSVSTSFTGTVEEALAPLLALQQKHGWFGDLYKRALVNQHLLRLRLREVGSMRPQDSEAVLAEASVDNRRGHMLVLYQLSENAAYRGDTDMVRQLGARLAALDAPHVSPMAWRGCKRHQALHSALNGQWGQALAAWRGTSVRQLPEPWRTRMAMLHTGELGVLWMLAGQWQRAVPRLRKAAQQLASMSAGARGSAFLSLALIAQLFQGGAVDPHEVEDLEKLGRRGFVLPRLTALLCRGIDSGRWNPLLSACADAEVPALWKTIALGAAARIAKADWPQQANAMAREALAAPLPKALSLAAWIQSEFPVPRPRAGEVSTAVLREIADLQPDNLAVGRPDLARQTCAALQRCYGSGAVLLDALEGAPELQEACQRARIAGEVAEDGICAVALISASGALAAKAPPSELPAMQALAHRLDELLVLSEARQRQEREQRQRRAMAVSAWKLASEEPFATRMDALATLAAAVSGADGVELALLRGDSVAFSTAKQAEFDIEQSRRLDDLLVLRLRALGGDPQALETAASDAAGALTATLRRAPEALRRMLGQSDAGDVVHAGGEALGTSPAAARLAQQCRRFADLELPVVIFGASGSGKDLAARALHLFSRRAGAPHVVLDCATLRVQTAASELFGHVRGAFTGALADHTGLLEGAGEGTLQLDNPGEMEGAIQAMLLRALQQRRFFPLGGTAERELRARLVVTTAQPLEELQAAGKLRPDLAQRLTGLNLGVPELAERGDDVLWLARHFAREIGNQFGRPVKLSLAAESALQRQHWPGNVRQLRSTVARAVALCTGNVIVPDDLRDPQTQPGGGLLRLPRDVDGLATGGRLVLAGLRELGAASAGELARRLGLGRTTVSQALSLLARRGLAARTGKGRATRYSVQE